MGPGNNSPCLPTHPLSSFCRAAEFSTLQWWVWSLRVLAQGTLSSCSLSSGESTSSSCERQRTVLTLGSFCFNIAFLVWPLILTPLGSSSETLRDGDLLMGTHTMMTLNLLHAAASESSSEVSVFLFPLQEGRLQAAQVHLARTQQERAPGWVYPAHPASLQ